MNKINHILLLTTILFTSHVNAGEDCGGLQKRARDHNLILNTLQSAVTNYEALIKEFEEGYTGNPDEEDAWYDEYVDAHVELFDLKRRLMSIQDISTLIKIRRQRHCGLPKTYSIPRIYNKRV